MAKISTSQTELSTAIYESFIEAAPLNVALLQGRDHRVIFANHPFRELAQHRALIDRPFNEVLPELNSLAPILDRTREAAMATGPSRQPVRLQSPGEIQSEDWQLDWIIQPLLSGEKSEQVLGLFALAAGENALSFPGSLCAKDLKRICELSNSLFIVVGTDYRLRRVSTTFASLLGWRLEEALSETTDAFVHPDDRERTRQRIRELTVEEGTCQFENRLLARDGSHRWISWTATLIPEEKTVYAAGRDVTEGKRAEQAMRREAEANAFRITLADAIRPLDRSDEIQRAAARVIGEHFDAVRANFALVLPGAEYALVQEEYARDVPSSIGQHVLTEYGKAFLDQARAGQIIAVEDTASDPRLGPGERKGYEQLQIAAVVVIPLIHKNQLNGIMTVSDIRPRSWTEAQIALMKEAAERVWSAIERAEAEAALRQSEERYRLVTRATNDVIWDLNAETDFITWNEAATAQFGYTPQELGHTVEEWYQHIHPDDRKRVARSFEGAIESGRDTWVEEYRFRKSDGRYATFLDRGHIARDASGRAYRMIGSMLNLTERRRAEEALREANAQLIESDRRKDEFLAMLAHELRNPMAAVQNAVRLLKRSITDPRKRHYMEILQRQSRTLSGLVDDLLDVSRVTRGLIMLKQERVSLPSVAERALESVRSLLEEKHHEARISIPQKPVEVMGDPVRLEQIVVNLLTNAAKYTDPGGEIELKLGTREERAELRVRDTGIGIAPDMLEHIFDLFGQAERGLDRAQGGLGIGLTIVKSLVELHGGSIEVHSAGLGHGSEFIVKLPLAPSRKKGKPSWDHPASGQVAGKRILVVEDSPDIAETMTLLLEEAGHRVKSVSDGPSALQQAEEFEPDLVLLDIGLPGMDGYEVAKRMRRNPHTRHSVLAALTGYGQASDRQLTEAAGFNAHFVKPVDLDALKNFINSARSRPE